MLLFQVGENWVSKRDKIKNDLQGSQDSLETKRKRYYHGLHDIFFFFFELPSINIHYFKQEKRFLVPELLEHRK